MLIGWKAAVNDRKIASLRYRVESPVRALQALGHAVELFDPHRADDYDVVIFAKTYSVRDRALAGRVRARGGRVVFDLCDNHFYNPHDVPKYRQVREELLDMLSLAQQVVCTTPTLAQVVREEAPWAATPLVIGDAVERLPPAKPVLEPFAGTRLLWFGSHGSPNANSGMADLLLIRDELVEAAARGSMELVVCSNSRAKYDEVIAPLPIASRYIDWTLDGFPGVLASADAVVIPISPNAFTAAKTHNRLSMALYAGTPVIADSIESYREFAPFCTLDDWRGGLERIAVQPEAERARAAGAHDYIEQNWTTEALALKWQAGLGLEPQGAQPAKSVAADGHRPAPLAIEGLRCQGGIDHRGVGQITGWARAASHPDRKLTVRLEQAGRVVATARADLPRPDLAKAGFADADCGFSLELPAEPADAPFEVVVEENAWRFDQPPFRLAFNGGGAFRMSVNGGAASAPAPAPSVQTLAVAADLPPQALASARAVQAELLEELERLNALMDEARDAAARLVVAAGDDATLGRRLLGLFRRDLKPELSRVLRWRDEDDRPAAPLN
jgi:hypothetical protein